jgi:hypothetical protein
VTNDRTKLAIEATIEVTSDRSKHGSQASSVDATQHLPRFYYRSEHRSQDRSRYRTEASKHRSEVWKHRRSEHRRIKEARSIKASIEASVEARTVEASTVEASTIEARYGSIDARYINIEEVGVASKERAPKRGASTSAHCFASPTGWTMALGVSGPSSIGLIASPVQQVGPWRSELMGPARYE